MLASGIAFNIALYLIPMFLVAIYMLNIFVDTENLSLLLEKVLLDFLPPTESNLQILHKIIEEIQKINLHSSLAGWIGLLALLWISSITINSFRSGLNVIFHTKAESIFILYRFKDILLTVGLSVLMLLYSYIVPMFNFVISFLEQYIPEIIHEMVSNALITSFSLATSFLLFLFIYLLVPTKRLPKFVVFNSTILCVLMIELARYIFAWYIVGFSNYGKFYGTYAVLVSMAIWLYYSSFILLISAEVVNFIYEKRQAKKQNAEDEILESPKSADIIENREDN